MEKKVSVIIPFYNGVDWLGEAVQSVLDQTYKNVEIIVVNDGSQEDTQSFLEKYGSHIIYHYQDNQGPAIARNNGMLLATGDYLAYLDSDDVWLPTKLEKQIGFMEANGFNWSHTGFYYWWPKTGKLKLIHNSHDYDDIQQQMRISFKMVTPSVVVSRRTMEDHPEIIFPVHMRKAQDSVYFTNLAKYYKVALIEEPLVKVRMRGDNSNAQVLMRFEKRAETYKAEMKDKSTPLALQITGRIYLFYHSIFGNKRNRIKEFVAKCLWVIPFSIERIYLYLIISKTAKDPRYLLKWNKNM